MELRTCNYCHQTKSIDSFRLKIVKNRKPYRAIRCKRCCYTIKNKTRRTLQKCKEANKKHCRYFRIRHPYLYRYKRQEKQPIEESKFKKRCRNKTKNAIRRGKITRQPCEKCGNLKGQSHHENYWKPFEIIWLCQKCHSYRHLEINIIKYIYTEKNIMCLPHIKTLQSQKEST